MSGTHSPTADEVLAALDDSAPSVPLPPEDVPPAVAPAVAPAAAAAAAAAADGETPGKEEESQKMSTADRDKYVGVKVARDFWGEIYVGEIKKARTEKGVDLFKVLYRDGDKEDYELKEVEEGSTKYNSLQDEMWNIMAQLVGLDAQGLKLLQDAGITSVSKLELFGGAKGGSFDSLDLPLITKQQLHVTATYLLNDGILTKDSTLEGMARFNLAKASGTAGSTRKRKAPATKAKTPAKKKTPKTKHTKSSAKKKKAGPPKFPDAVPKESPHKKRPPPKERSPPAPRSARAAKSDKATPKKKAAAPAKDKSDTTPKKKAPATPKIEVYRGPPNETMEGVPDWPLAGWEKVSKKRGSSAHVDHEWKSPGGKLFRSSLAVRKFLKALADSNGDEAAAWKNYKTVDLKA